MGDDVLSINHHPMKIMKRIKVNYKLKDDKIEEHEMYLSADLNKIPNINNDECWTMLSDKYCQVAATNVEKVLKKDGLQLPLKWFQVLYRV